MVDALRSSRRVLRPRGIVVDTRPAASYQPRLLIRRGRRRVEVGPIQRDPDLDVVEAGRAVQRSVRERWFDVARRTRVRWRSHYGDPADLERMVAANINPKWHLPTATKRRLAKEWREGDSIEVTRVFTQAILRKRGR